MQKERTNSPAAAATPAASFRGSLLRVVAGSALSLLGLAGYVSSVLHAAPRGDTVWSGVYSSAQATRGEAAYTAECSQCHRSDLSAYGGILTGDRFLNEWREDTLNSFFKILRQTMPRNTPASLSDSEYLDIVAYILKMNEFPAGEKDLTAENLPNVRIEARQGPQAVPDFSLVEVTGCLTQTPDGAWLVAGATEPRRTRNPNASSADELRVAGTQPPGTNRFRLLETASLQSKPAKDQRALVKGFLIRKAGDDRINPSWLQLTGAACQP